MLDALLRSSSKELMGFAEMPTRLSRVLMLAWTRSASTLTPEIHILGRGARSINVLDSARQGGSSGTTVRVSRDPVVPAEDRKLEGQNINRREQKWRQILRTQQVRTEGHAKMASPSQSLAIQAVTTLDAIYQPLTSMNPSSVASSKDESGGDGDAALMVSR